MLISQECVTTEMFMLLRLGFCPLIPEVQNTTNYADLKIKFLLKSIISSWPLSVLLMIYFLFLIFLTQSNLQYIGSATTDFRVRFCNHKSAMVTKKKTCEEAVHFNRTPHEFSFQCIDQVHITANNSSNITKEAYWSAQLFSLAPFGLNKHQEFHSKKRINYNWHKNNYKFGGYLSLVVQRP